MSFEIRDVFIVATIAVLVAQTVGVVVPTVVHAHGLHCCNHRGNEARTAAADKRIRDLRDDDLRPQSQIAWRILRAMMLSVA